MFALGLNRRSLHEEIPEEFKLLNILLMQRLV